MKIKLLFLISCFLFFSCRLFAQSPVNDDPCNATPLTAGTGCNYVTGTTTNATATTGVPAPGCANYVGGDVWFSVTVPASGSLIFDSNTGVVTDGGMAIYSGTCGNLTLISCNDDGSANGLMPSISANGLTPGSNIYIRFWEYGNDNPGDFSICVEQVTPCATVSTNSSCASADPFCTGTSYDYCNTVNVPSLGGGGVYGCCLSTPNPAFYFMNIQSTGPITFNISQNTNAGVGIDVDFVLWGPFASQGAMCAGLAAGNIVDCSYSTAAVETATIPNANAGEWYMMLITNFSNQPGNIQFSQTNSNTAGSGATNCNILTAIPGLCTSGYFTLTGTVDVPGPPSTGILTITNSSGGTQVFNAPFSSSIAYSIPNICGDGNAHSVTAVFSAAGAPIVLPANYTAPSCNTLTATPGPCVGGQYTLSGTLTTNSCMPTTGTLTISSSCGGSVVYNAPFTSPLNWSLPPSNGNGGNCTIKAIYSATGAPTIDSIVISEPQCCGANAGTVTTTATNGTVSTSGSNTQVVLCPGGSVSLVSNNDYVLPPSYDPGWDDSELFYAIYLPPGPTVPDPDLDPNWTGYYWTGQDFANSAYSTNSSNCGSPILNLPGINATNNTLVFVPITADDGDNGLDWDNVVAHDQNGDGCFDIGNPISITFLNPITFTSTATCSGSMSVQINGGYPEFLTGLYTIINTGSGTLSATSATAGGSVTISGLTTGQTYSINVTDAGGCVAAAYSGVYQGPPTISLTATPSTICLGSCSTLSATVNSGVTSGNTTLTNSECAIIADGGIGAINGNPSVNTGNWAHTCIDVSGVCDQTWNTGDVLSVKINLIHAFDADLDIYLQAPNGVYYLLSQDLGGAGVNYTNTVFSATGAAVIAGWTAAAPFTGIFKPLGAGNNFSSLNGTSINGSWCLWVGDDGAIDQGSIQNWSLTFANQTTFTYAWSPATGLSATNVLTPTACPTTSTSYTLTVTNACGCTATATVPITVTPPVTPIFNSIGPICLGSSAPSLPTTSTNGITGTWAPSTISNLASGVYTFTPTSGQCANATTLNVTIIPAPVLTSITTSPLCIGNTNGSIDLTASGGVTPYSYLWSTGSTNQDLSSLSAGTYTVTVSSSNGCTSVLTNVVTAPISVNASIVSTTNINCFGQSTGSILASGNGGIGPYTYLWSNGTTTNAINNLPVGVYTITVTDANGCTNNANASATLVQQPQLLLSLLTVSNVGCFGGANGSITASPIGGTAGYNYSWSNGVTSATISNLITGSYTVTVTDSRGCTNSASTIITQPTQLTLSIPSTTNVLCNGGATGSATALAANGTLGYSYQWNNGATTATINNLTAGTYTVTATDANGCTTSTTATITQPTSLTLSIPSTTNVICNGGSTGSATALAVNGTPVYTYLWSTGATTSSISNLIAGTYTVTATDANGCTTSKTTTITQPTLLTISIPSTTNVLCNGGTTGSVTALAANGTSGYTYQWNTGATSGTINNLTAGTYTVTANDVNGCTATTSTTLTQPTPLALSPSSTTSTCGQSNGSASVNVSGGVSAYTYLWSSGQNASSILNVASGVYIVTITDANGCTASASANVGSIGGPTVTLASTNNVSCFGGTNGSAQVNVSSGTGPFVYNWLPIGGGTNTASNLSAGSYSVNVTDANGCTSSVSVVITQPTQVVVTISSLTNVLCNGGTTGSVTALAANGTSGYTYQWNTGGTTAIINNLTAGTYTVTATDANGCTTSTTATISQPTSLTISIPSTTNVLCNGGATGSATALAANGTSGYTYQWNTGGTTAIINNLTAGTYTVTATDANGCTTSTTATISQPIPLTLSIPTTTNVLCNGGATGSATALASNGTSGYTYQWNTGASSATINNLTAGTYTVITTDANGCTKSTTATITQPTLLMLSIPSTTNLLCNGGATGSATALAANGTSGYTYHWNTGATSATINNLTAGIYTVTATDANGCTTSTTATISQPIPLTLSIPTTTNVLCNGGATGSASVSSSGGTGSYTYLWSTGSTTSSVSNLNAGTYTITATDANGCTTSTTATITQPSLLTLSIPSTTNVLCNGGSTGSATTLAANGTAGYAYQWSTGATSATINNLTAGIYTVTATDANGCTTLANATITQPTLLTLSIPSTTNVLCNGGATGSATALASNGTAGYTYQWNTGATTATINNLIAGTYTVTATDANGCTTSTTATITQPTLLTLSIPSTTNVLCNGGATGSATALAANGTSGYTYQWNTGATSATINNLTAGIYTVTATDATGCTTVTTATISQPTQLTISIPSTTNVLCNGGATGSATALAANGTSGYTYQWSNGAITTTINNLLIGTYTVTATDMNGCTAITTTMITQPQALVMSSSSTISTCGQSNGSASVSVSGGVAGYAYLWSSGQTASVINNVSSGGYVVTVTDGNGCTTNIAINVGSVGGPTITLASITNISCFGGANGSAQVNVSSGTGPFTYNWVPSGGAGVAASSLAAGSYSVNVTDANGCTSSVSLIISQPTQVSVSIPSITNVLCNGGATGSVTALAANGTSGYSYQWNTGATTATINNLSAGTYTLTATDANGCTASNIVTVAQPSPLSLSILSTNNILCNGGSNGSVTSIAFNGTSGYNYSWSTGATSATISNITSGIYTVSVTDGNGCTISTTATITQPTPLAISIPSTTNVLCNGGATGTATALASNGTSGYSYQWNTGATSATINNLTAGIYTVTATDANGCTTATTATITQPTPLTISIPSSTNVLCNGGATGSATVLAANGTSGYTYQWNTGGTNSIINNLTAGTYTVTATDANGCTTSTTATITQPTPLTISIPSTTNVLCNGGGIGSATALAANGTSGYSYQWNTGATTTSINNLTAGTYTVTATDANGCTASTIAKIAQPSALALAISSTTNVLCNGGNTGSVTAQASNGTAGYSYSWNNGSSTASINNLTAGTYTLTATDANGCTTSTTATIIQPSALTLSIPVITNVLCNGANTGGATALASNGTAGYTYQWNTGATTAAVNNLTAGNYTVTATDVNGCSISTTTNITQPSVLTVSIPTTTNVLCNGGTTGSATALAANGTSGYTYLWNTGATTAAVNNLTAGTYTVIATDANGCTTSTTTNITQPSALTLSIPSTTNVLCNGGTTGSATALATNGTAGYSYLWSNGSTTAINNNLTAGTYTVTATDANGCTISLSAVISQPTAISLSSNSSSTLCGVLNGSASVVGIGGSGAYSYLWSGGQTTPSINNVASGGYVITVTDANGCTISTSVNIGSIGGPTVAITNSSNVSCFGGASGSAQVTVSSGTGPFSYAWLPTGGSTISANNLIAGNYSVNVTDANGCTSSTSVSIIQPSQLTVSIPSTTNVLCYGGATGSATAFAANGTSGYVYLWNNGSTTAAINNLTAGTYTVTATDGNGCTASSSTVITQPSILSVAIPTTINVLCNGGASGSVTALASNGTTGYTYLWSNGGILSTISNLTVGTYVVTATDGNGCTASISTTITEPSILNLQTFSNAATCGQLNGSAGVIVSGGVGSYTYLWNNGQNSNSINAVASGFYSVKVTDLNGCTANVFINVGNIGGPTVAISSFSNVSCFGSANGSAQVSVNAGIGPYTYNWLPSGGNNAVASNLSAGNYLVNVTDANGCNSSTSVIVSEPAALIVSGSSTPSSCGQLNGTASVNVAGGVAGYSYSWSGGQTTSSINNVLTGAYSLTVTDANGCTINSMVNVGSIGGASVAISNSSNVSCFGGANGTAQVNINTGVGPYTYSWSPSGGSNATASNLTAGNFSVYVTDANGCTSSVSVIITEPATMVVQTTSADAICGQANGSAGVIVSGGVGAYSYLWNGSQTNSSILNIVAGSYSVTITDGNGCTLSQNIVVSNIAGPAVAVSNSTNVSCYGGSNGSAQLNVNAGAAPYTYFWSPSGGNSSSANNLTAGNYLVTVTDGNGCSASTTIMITEPSQLSIAIPSSTNVLCFGGASGSITALANNGTSGYAYLWSNGASTASINSIVAGIYTVTVTDANGCKTLASKSITQPSQLSIAIPSASNVLCFGGSTGSATALASNGTSGYSYLWNNGSVSATINNLAAATYTVTATDANGCTVITTTTILQPTALSIAIPSTSNVLCNGGATGSATALASNGTTGYSYLWSNGGVSATINNLLAGTYTVTTTDGNGCTSSTNATITQPSPLTLTIPSTTNVLCYGGSNGSATALASNGTANYSYSWNNGSISSTNNNLTAGTYTVTTTDANGCTTFNTTTITQPVQLAAAIPSTTNVLCFGGSTGSATADASNGTANYSYLWNNGATTAFNSNLSSGNYTVTVTDANGCTSIATTFINQPTALSLSNFNSQNVSCNGLADGNASVSISGGTPPYDYNWNPLVSTSNIANSLISGNYDVIATDNNGCSLGHAFLIMQPNLIQTSTTIFDAICYGSNNGAIASAVVGGTAPYSYNWSTGGIQSSLSGLTTGNYTLTVTDAHGCTNITTWSVNEPAALSSNVTNNDASCYGLSDGSIQVNVNGGTPTYQIAWTPSNAGFNLSNLPAGSYSAIVTDAHGCTHALAKLINQPPQIVVNASTPNIICIGQSQTLSLLVSGGTPAYSYLWSNQQTTSSILVSPTSTTNYSVTITDNNGCTASINNLLVNVYPPLQLNLTANNDTICIGQNSLLAALVTGGNGGPYAYAWSNGFSSNSQSVAPTQSGSYMVAVSDGCTTPGAQQAVNIVVNPNPSPAFSPGNIQGCSPINASFNMTSASGLGYSYQWAFGDNTSSTLLNPSHQYTNAGAYNVTLTVTNQFGCTASVTNNNVVTVYPKPIAKFTPDPYETQLITATINFYNHSIGANYYDWSFGDNATSLDFSPTHLYGDTGIYEIRLIASSTHQCRDTAYEYVHITGSFTFWCPNAFSPNEDLKNDEFTGYGIGIKSATFTIYNRWGEKIYLSDNLENPWNGTFWNNGDKCPEGVYVYLFDVIGDDNEHHKYTGRVSLVR